MDECCRRYYNINFEIYEMTPSDHVKSTFTNSMQINIEHDVDGASDVANYDHTD